MKIVSRIMVAGLTLTPVAASAAEAVPPTSGIAGVLTSLIAVLVLILLLAWGVKRFQIGGNAGAIRVIAAASLGARDRILLVQVGDTQLLVGVGSGGMRTLHVLDQPLTVPAGPQSDTPFARRLRDMVGGSPQ
ncbi:MAG: flagellar biosynthetic protein FliO [Gammaproteobacteria bacterium]|jgi:flagellar protein FliO/FliZ